MDDVERDVDDARFCEHVPLQFYAHVILNFCIQFGGIVRIAADEKKKLRIPVDVRRMTDVLKWSVVRHYPLEPVEVTPRENRVIKPHYHLERNIPRLVRQLPAIPAVVIVYIFGILLFFGSYFSSFLVVGLCFQVLRYHLARTSERWTVMMHHTFCSFLVFCPF